MKKNIGTTDRLLRLAIALILLGAAWWWASWIVFIVACFAIYEALVGWCLVYQLLGKNSCPIDR